MLILHQVSRHPLQTALPQLKNEDMGPTSKQRHLSLVLLRLLRSLAGPNLCPLLLRWGWEPHVPWSP